MSGTAWWSILALAVASLSSVISLLKEKRAKHGSRWHRYALLTLTLIGFGAGAILIHGADAEAKASEGKHKDERATDQQRIADLKDAIAIQISNNETQYDRNQDQLQGVRKQLADLQTQVATEELRKKMTALQGQLDKALAPTPKAQVEPSFWEAAVQDQTVSDIYAPVEGNVVSFSLSPFNHSEVDAKNVTFWIRLCDGCKFHTDDQGGFIHITGAPEFEREFRFGDLVSGSRTQKITVQAEVPPGFDRMIVATKYRCDTCLIEKSWQQMSVALGRTHFPKSSPLPPQHPNTRKLTASQPFSVPNQRTGLGHN